MPIPLRGYKSKVKQFDKNDMYKYMSPFDKNNEGPMMPLGATCGNYLVVDSQKRSTITTNGNQQLVLLCPSSRGIANAIHWEYNSSNQAFEYVSSSIPDLSTTWKFSADDGLLFASCLRAGCRLTNTSNGNTRSGIVRILQASSPLDLVFDLTNPLNLTTDASNSIKEAVLSNPRTRSYNAEFFATSADKQCIAGPSSVIGYSSWGNNKFDKASAGLNLGQLSVNIQNSQKQDFHMNNILILFEPESSGNVYEIQYGTQHRFRYELNTLLGQLQKPPKKTDKVVKTLDTVSQTDGVVEIKETEPGPIPGVPTPTPAEIKQARADAKAAKKAAEAKAAAAAKAKPTEKKSTRRR